MLGIEAGERALGDDGQLRQPDFTRDGFRCTDSGCTARRNPQSDHIRFRSARRPHAAWNRTTLCAVPHHHCAHARSLEIRGRAPASQIYALRVRRFRSGT